MTSLLVPQLARLALLMPSAAGDPPTFVETRIDAGSGSFEYQLADVDGDDRLDLLVTTAHAGERTLRLWKQRPDSAFPQAPDFRMAVPPDVVGWSLLDVRATPGRELLLLTRSGVFSLTTTQAGLQGNVRRELALPLFPEIADPERLPCWRLMNDVDGDGRDELLVVSGTRLVALGTKGPPGEATTLQPVLELDSTEAIEQDDTANVAIGDTGIHVRSRSGLQSLFPGYRSSRPLFQGERLFAQRRGFKIPALLDWNHDGRLDAVRFGSRAVTVRTRREDGSFEPRDAAFTFPSAGDGAEGERTPRSRAQLMDCDGDGRTELVLERDDGDGFGKESIAMIFARGADGAPADTPLARVKLPGMDVDYTFLDVDRDRRVDVLARVIDIPTGLTTLATIRLDVKLLLYRGLEGGQLSREPQFRLERSFKPEQLTRVQETLQSRLDGDFDADGICDLVLTQLDGRVEIRRVVRGATALVLEERPFASFVPPALVQGLETFDLSDDGVADLLLRHDRALTLFVSRRNADR